MRFLKYIFIVIISCIGLTACVDEVITEKNEPVWQEGDVPYYIMLKLQPSSDTFTRAGEGENNRFENFQEGVHKEHDICPNAYNFAIFFDENDKYISCGDLYSVNETAALEQGDKSNNIPATESTYKCRFYGFANSKPAKVLVVVNAPKKVYDQVTEFPGFTLEEVMRNQVWNELGDPRDNLGLYVEENEGSMAMYFTMTNSTYLTKGDNGEYKLNCAQAIPEGSITTDPTEIGELNPVTVYLERMVSKFELTPSFDVSKYIPTNAQALDVCTYTGGDFTYSAYNWGIELLAWGVNGLETSNYLFKNVPYKSEELTTSLSSLYENGWNSAYNRRCFWSEDPHYYKDTDRKVVYPWQYDDARDRYDSSHQEYYQYFESYDNSSKNFALAYYPFQSFCQKEDGTGSFITEDGVVEDGHSYRRNLTFYSPENTFVPGLTVDRSRGSRAYELAGTHLLLCARLLLPKDGSDYQPFDGNLYKNRVGVSYVNEASMFKDFMNAVNYKLTSQKYFYYKYYDWDESSTKTSFQGHTIRARSEGDYALYCYFPYKQENTTITDLVKKAFNNDNIEQKNGVIIELTYNLIDLLDKDGHYQLYKDADAINADGKVIPWIMYRENGNEEFKPLRMMILERQPGDAEKNEYKDYITHYNYGDKSNPDAEFILGDPEKDAVKNYLSGTQGNRIGLSTWASTVRFDNFKVTSSQGDLFSDDFSKNLSNWTVANTAINGKGNWSISNGQLYQGNNEMEGEILYVNNKTFPRSYTIETEATVTGGKEGFLVVFNYFDENNFCWWNVGGWGNTHHALELAKGNRQTKDVFDYKEGTLIYNHTYRVMVRVNGSNVKCYLDGQLIHDVTMPLGREIMYEAWEIPEGASDNYTGDDNDVQSIFYETWGMADCFKNGLMYYAVPIYAQTQNGKPAIDYDAQLEEGANKDFIDDEKLKYYYGVVRNNWYKFTLHSINDIGIPVFDPTKPIVPNYDNKLDQNKVEMEILQWHIDEQTVEIPF